MKLQRGARHGCVLLQLLLNLNLVGISQRALEETNVRTKVHGRPLNNIKYQDTNILLAGNPQELQKLIQK